MYRLCHSLLLIALYCCLAQAVHARVTGAEINESFIEVDLFVGGNALASDKNDGTTAERPFRTIQAAATRALQFAQENQGVRVNIAPGTYREAIVLEQSEFIGNALIVFQGMPGGPVTISGSDVLDGWKVGDSDCFELKWPYEYDGGMMSIYPSLMMRSELVFVQGARVIQVGSKEEVIYGGRFFVDDQEGTAFMLPPKNGTVAEGKVQVGNPKRAVLFKAKYIDELVLRNLLFVHAPSRPGHGEAAVQIEKSNYLLIENCATRYNGHIGIAIQDSDNISLKVVHSKNNGWAGLHVKGCKNVAIDASEVDLNGWRVLNAKYPNKETLFAVNLQNSEELLIDNLRCAENRTSGLGAHQLQEAKLYEISAIANEGHGLVASGEEAVAVKYGRYLHNKMSGVKVAGAMVLEGNVLYDNFGHQLSIDAFDFNASRNIIGASEPDRPAVRAESYEQAYRPSFQSSKTLFHLHNEKPFSLNGLSLSFEQWQLALGIDLDSTVGDPTFVDPARYEYTPEPDSIWFEMRDWPVRELTDDQIRAAYADLFKSN